MAKEDEAMATQAVDQLNSFLRGEISAVETYRKALNKVNDVRARTELEQCHMSHQQRVDLLRMRIKELGGEPAQGSGPWGAFAKVAEGGAAAFGEKAAIDVLEEGEDHGLKDYQTHLNDLDSTSRTFVEQELLPAQQRTHRALSTLKHTLH
jgi:demethoxyubiquinone hydroxylase (CLK1/Coq7/Cat5 family)